MNKMDVEAVLSELKKDNHVKLQVRKVEDDTMSRICTAYCYGMDLKDGFYKISNSEGMFLYIHVRFYHDENNTDKYIQIGRIFRDVLKIEDGNNVHIKI